MSRVTLTIHIDLPDGLVPEIDYTRTPAAVVPPAAAGPSLADDDVPWPAGVTTKPEVSAASVAAEQCPVHHVSWKVVPAGVSKKTGKPYTEFKACPEQGCDERPR